MLRFLAMLGAITALSVAGASLWPKSEDPSVPEVVEEDESEDRADNEPTPTAKQADLEFSILPLDAKHLTEEELQRTIVLGNGDRLWALNGCKKTSHLPWAATRTKTPVVEVVRGPAYDMYRHADGSFTTTVLMNDPNTGELAAGGMHWRPIDIGDKQLIMGEASQERRVPMNRERPSRR